MPTYEAALSFSVETAVHQPTMGVHKPWTFLDAQQQQSVRQMMADFDRRAFEEAEKRWGVKA